MLNSLESLLKSEFTTTQNGAKVYTTTNNNIVDFFFNIGNMRKMNENDIIVLFMNASYIDRLVAMKILFYTRDIREGLGERRVFKVITKYLSTFHPEYIKDNLKYISEFGRWDDLISLLECNNFDISKEIINIINNQLKHDMQSNNPSLLAKWMPVENCSNKSRIKLARLLMNKLGLSNIVYRKVIVNIRKKIDLIESKLTKKDYKSIDYNKVPSIANKKYHKAFRRNDTNKYLSHLENVLNGKKNTKINASVLYPYQVIADIINKRDICRNFDNEFKMYCQVLWDNLKQIEVNESLNAICVVDTSGSMTSDKGLPLASAIALSLLFSSKFKGIFENCFITFSSKPRFVKIPRDLNIVDKVLHVLKYEEYSNTNIKATFDLLLNTAILNNLNQSQIPDRLIIISDMEFDISTSENIDDSLFSAIKNKWNNHGYKLPYITFWKVSLEQSKLHYPVKETEFVQFVSGHSPNIFKSIANNEFKTPMETILDIVNSERYSKIK